MSNGPNAQGGMSNEPNAQVGMSNGPNAQAGMSNGPNAQVGMSNGPNAQAGMSNGPNAQASMFNGPNAPHDMFNGPNAPPSMFNGPSNIFSGPAMNNYKGYGNGKGLDVTNIPMQMMDQCTCKGGNYNEIRSGNERGRKCNVDHASKNKEVDVNKRKKKSVGGLLGRYLGFNNRSSKNGKEWEKCRNDLDLFEFDLLRHNAKMSKRGINGTNGIVGQMGLQMHQNGPMGSLMHQNGSIGQMGQPMHQNGLMGQQMHQNGPMGQMGQPMHQNVRTGQMGQTMPQNGPMGQPMHQNGSIGQPMHQNVRIGQMGQTMPQNGSIGQMANVPAMDRDGQYYQGMQPPSNNHQQQQDMAMKPMIIDQQQQQQPNMNMYQPDMLPPNESHHIVDPFTYVFSDENTEASCIIM
ncbi:hypothetical protein TanjilG_29299 [Lupinus angustifolius]|uniref:Uncharacterized protein n=1 Tax=Lupinus angustifolius TaxID=3871 RepID=A0A1J7HL40_LUPAN|nr:hypothetical protein TanjilG_29299 [Lupinus angustifolius]